MKKKAAQLVEEYMKDHDIDETKKDLLIETVAFELMRQAEEMKQLEAAVRSYNDFYNTEAQEPDFKETQTFAVDHFFYSLDPAKQAAVADAYQRIEKNAATVADVQIVMEFFTDAKNARRADHHIMVEYIDADRKAQIRSNFVDHSVTICAHNAEEAAAAYPTAEEMYRAQV